MYQPQNTLTVLQNTLTAELNTLTLPDISVEEHGRVVEGQGVDGPATEHLDLLEELDVVRLCAVLSFVHEDVDVVVAAHRQQFHIVLTRHRR